MPEKPRVLIAAKHHLVAALLGLLLEARGFEALFPAAEESCVAAIGRHRPVVVLVDIDHPEGCADDLFTFARGFPTRVVLFSGGRDRADVANLAKRWEVESFALPISAAEIGALIERVIQH